MVADDDRLIRTIGAVRLEDIAEVREASNGEEVLTALQQADVDLLLLDRDMPAPDGLAVLANRPAGFPHACYHGHGGSR